MNSLPAWQLTSFLALHFGAIACAIGTRVAANSRFELPFQCMFLPALGAVGIATWYTHSDELGIGIFSGATLIAMVLLAVTDLRRTHEPGHAHQLAMHR